ncbi:MAG TPA: glucokinase [Colwellia sp.]|nr:glucokinase [Colwellia sp.]|tara:strand:+ start:3509 stop:4510 length:1002 start_codon:yes stop_codon:yes gene_type:complete
MKNSHETQVINLVADIGGTNIRLAITDNNNNISEIETYQCQLYPHLSNVIHQYLTDKNLLHVKVNACLAIACPVDTDAISMTNLPWKFSQKQLKEELKLNSLTLINDYTAIAMAIPLLTDEQKVKIGGGAPALNQPIAVCGPGTGLGVANLENIDGHWHCLGGEGGHIDFAPVDELDIQIFQQLKKTKKRISYEQLLSGYGLEQTYQALLVINNQQKNDVETTEPSIKLSAKDISTKALAGSCKICQQALSQFCKVLGSFAGNLALTTGSIGGVYIAGGIVPRFVDYLKNSEFRERFETKGRMSHLNEQTPTYIITESQPGLLGAAAYLNQLC